MKTKPWAKSFLFLALFAFGLVNPALGMEQDSKPADSEGKPEAPEGFYDNSFALVMGVSAYSGVWPDLPDIPEDMEAIKKTLERGGFSVTEAVNPDSQGLRRALVDFINAHGAEKSRRILVYFVGRCHNVVPKFGGDAMEYLVPSDAPDPDKNIVTFRESALALYGMDTYARNILARQAIFILEGCGQSSSLGWREENPREEDAKNIFNSARQFILLGSSQKSTRDADQSFLRKRLIQALEGAGDLNGDRVVTASELAGFLQDQTGEKPGGRGKIVYGSFKGSGEQTGDFVFTSPSPPESAGESLPSTAEKLPDPGAVKEPGPQGREDDGTASKPAPPSVAASPSSEFPSEKASEETPEKQPPAEESGVSGFWPPERTKQKNAPSIHEETFRSLHDRTHFPRQ
ncbi:MAG: caspase family protein [Nitrospinales bacterium]